PSPIDLEHMDFQDIEAPTPTTSKTSFSLSRPTPLLQDDSLDGETPPNGFGMTFGKAAGQRLAASTSTSTSTSTSSLSPAAESGLGSTSTHTKGGDSNALIDAKRNGFRNVTFDSRTSTTDEHFANVLKQKMQTDEEEKTEVPGTPPSKVNNGSSEVLEAVGMAREYSKRPLPQRSSKFALAGFPGKEKKVDIGKLPSGVVQAIVEQLLLLSLGSRSESTNTSKDKDIDGSEVASTTGSVTSTSSIVVLKKSPWNLAEAVKCLTICRSWSRGAAKALYKRPNLYTADKFHSFISTLLDPETLHPYAAFVLDLVLTPSLSEDLHLGDIDVALQLFPNLTTFQMTHAPNSSNVLIQSLSDHCHKLTTLRLRGCPITDAMIPSLTGSCPRLKVLDLAHTHVSLAALIVAVDTCEGILEINMEASAPSPIPVTWSPMHQHTRPLRRMNLANSGVTDAHLRHVALHCPDLMYVVLEGCAALTDDSVIRLAQSCGGLRRLDLSFCMHVTDLALRAFTVYLTRGCLKFVNLSGLDRITAEGVLVMVEGLCDGLEEVLLHGCAGILNSFVRDFAVRNYELDCAVRGDAIRLLASYRAGRERAGILGIGNGKGGEVVEEEKKVLKRGNSRDVGVQTVTVDVGDGGDAVGSPPRVDSATTGTEGSVGAGSGTLNGAGSAGDASSSTSNRNSVLGGMGAEALLLKFAEAVASGTWFPPGMTPPAVTGAGQQQPMPGMNGVQGGPPPGWAYQGWNPMWGYPPMMPPYGAVPPNGYPMGPDQYQQ
ncbi:hypothetical protein HDU76_009197, partial [Blyttiomyces sp. JEL0837]